ncbi:hypothetical protein Barb7_00915 [Bacteroidales bacterium Barb7]|nr:hypothetical protein Barb7_00915 [Bacteroidales bacterium Barb7]
MNDAPCRGVVECGIVKLCPFLKDGVENAVLWLTVRDDVGTAGFKLLVAL